MPSLHQVGLQRLDEAHNPARAIEDIDYFRLRTGFDYKAQTFLYPLPAYQGLPGHARPPCAAAKAPRDRPSGPCERTGVPDDARFVQYEQVAGTQVATQVVKDGVLHFAAVPRQHQKA